jgi:hypothetical protein
MPKEKMLKALDDLPDNASIEDAMERLLFLAKVERGLQEADSGQTLSHVIVKSKARRKYSLSQLLKGITKDNRHPEHE